MLGKFLQKTVNLGWWGVFELVPPPEPPDVGLCWAGGWEMFWWSPQAAVFLWAVGGDSRWSQGKYFGSQGGWGCSVPRVIN